MTSPRDESPTGTSKHLSSENSKKTVLFVFGTRPEAIKLAPLIAAFRQRYSSRLIPVICVTGQHREMLDQVLSVFKIVPDVNLDVMISGQTLNTLTSALVGGLEPALSNLKPTMTVVQG